MGVSKLPDAADLSVHGFALATTALTHAPFESVLPALDWLWKRWRSNPDVAERRLREEVTLYLLAVASPEDRSIWFAEHHQQRHA